jgi:anti-anti-sigma factor
MWIDERTGRWDRRGRWPISEGARTPLRVTAESDPDAMRIMLHGELDFATSSVVERALYDAERNPQREVIVDLANLRFLDSSGVLLFLRASERARIARRGFWLINPRPSITRLLETTMASHLLDPQSIVDLDAPAT